MDAKVTLSFDKHVVEEAKELAATNNISLSRLTEFLLRKATTKTYKSLDDMPVSDWVSMVAEGQAEYITKKKSRATMKDEYLSSKK